jgi:hypothetical protein
VDGGESKWRLWCEVVGGRYWDELLVSGGVRKEMMLWLLCQIDSDVMQVEDGESMVAGWVLLIARCCQCCYDNMVLLVW